MLKLYQLHANAGNMPKAITWAQKAATVGSRKGMVLAFLELARDGHARMEGGGENSARNPETARVLEEARYFLERALQNGYNPRKERENIYALFMDLGDCYFFTDRRRDAFECYLKTNNLEASIALAAISASCKLEFLTGTCTNIVLTDDEEAYVFNRLVKALRSKKLNKDNTAEANYMLGSMYEYGIGTKKNINKACSSFERAKKLGHAESARDLKHYRKKLFGGYEYIG